MTMLSWLVFECKPVNWYCTLFRINNSIVSHLGTVQNFLLRWGGVVLFGKSTLKKRIPPPRSHCKILVPPLKGAGSGGARGAAAPPALWLGGRGGAEGAPPLSKYDIINIHISLNLREIQKENENFFILGARVHQIFDVLKLCLY